MINWINNNHNILKEIIVAGFSIVIGIITFTLYKIHKQIIKKH